MPSWWSKSSSKEVKKKTTKENVLGTPNRLVSPTEQRDGSMREGGKQTISNTISQEGSRSRVESLSTSPSCKVPNFERFTDGSHAQSLPVPVLSCAPSGVIASTSMLEKHGKAQLHLPLPEPCRLCRKPDATDVDGDLATASVSSTYSVDSDDQADSRLLSSAVNDVESGGRVVSNINPSIPYRDQSSVSARKNSKEVVAAENPLLNNQFLSTPLKPGVLSNCQSNLQSPGNGAFASAPDSSMSSPCRSPMRVVCPKQILTAAFLAPKSYLDVNFLGSGQCSSSGSGHTSGHNSMGGGMSGHVLWPQGRGSPECSPIPSPRLASPGSGSRIHSRAVSPRHPRAGEPAPELSTSRHEEGKMLSHPLPLLPINIYNASPFSSNNSTPNTLSSISRSPGRTDSPAKPGSGWKKGKLIGRGTFGHVYVGFNSDSGEMCAMKEVTLFSDDAKSKESAKQLGQEISLLRRLQHPNIVQYYGCEVIDDKFYIYLEYVAGGSIHKLLQEYGQLGEAAIRSFTQQILSGLAYLHAKNTVHRDIKGANILVDPTGRVKLADFGMAKHINGQSCPFSLKGSPYWMAPEVIRNTNGCNLAVDIWSLGCTVLEMATSKPPWSQFEGIAAMFKIGNSKQLPPIPDHLSEVGKDFIRRCLQRDPSQRPTAVKLLQHPFVRNVVPVVKSILSSEFIDQHTDVSIGRSFRGVGHAGNFSPLHTGQMIHQLKGARTALMISGTHPTGIMSCPVSPVRSPLLNPGSLHHSNRKKSASPISSPITISGSSTPLTGGNGFTPFNQLKPLGFLHECYSNKPRPNHPLRPTPKLDLYHGGQKGSTVSHEQGTSESEICTHQLGSATHVNLLEPNDKQSMWADNVSHQLLREHSPLKPSLDLSCSSPMLAHTCGT